MAPTLVVGGVSQVGISSGLVTTATSGATSAAIIQGSITNTSTNKYGVVENTINAVGPTGVVEPIKVATGVTRLLENGVM